MMELSPVNGQSEHKYLEIEVRILFSFVYFTYSQMESMSALTFIKLFM